MRSQSSQKVPTLAANLASSVVDLASILQALTRHLEELSLLGIALGHLVSAQGEEGYIETGEILVE